MVDFENVQPANIGSLVPGECRILIFLGQNQSKVPLALSRALQPFGKDVEYLQISGIGPNAVDFHVAFYVGKLAMLHPQAQFTIVSKDTGFDPLLRHLTSLKIACNRVATLGAPSKSPSKKATPVVSLVGTKVMTATKPTTRKDVAVSFASNASGEVSKAKAASDSVATRVTEVVKRLRGLKAAKPAKLKTLQSSLRSWFKPALKQDEVGALITALRTSKKISVDGTKVVYTLG